MAWCLTKMSRRGFLLASCSAASIGLVTRARGDDSGDPWSKTELMEPRELATLLNSHGVVPHMYCVAFPVLYRGKHIPGAVLTGPANKAEGIQDLRKAVGSLPKNAAIVIYCGCCPMKDCPNIRPAYRTLRELEFNNLRVLELPTSFHTDWVLKGYPVA